MAVTSLASVLSHWDQLHEGLQESPQAFYDALEKSLERRAIPNATVSRVEQREAGILSAKRLYLRVEREHLCFDVCAAPFGSGFFTSWWFAETDINAVLKVLLMFGLFMGFGLSLLIPFIGTFLYFSGLAFSLFVVSNIGGELERWVIGTPVVGWFYRRFVKPPTYFQLDSMLMFQHAVHTAVLEVVDGMTTAKGLRALTADERKPIIRDFFKRDR